MSGVSRLSARAPLGAVAPRQAGTGSAFQVSAETPAVENPAPLQPAGLLGMLVLQEAEAGSLDNRKGRGHGAAVLDALRELQRSLLSTGGEAPLARLTHLATSTPAVTDPQLEGLLSAIRLRARIELFRRGMESG